MTLVQGKHTDVSYSVVDYTSTRIGFELNGPNVSESGTMIADRVKWVTTDAAGNWSVTLAPTEGMRPGAFYTAVSQYRGEGGAWWDLDVFPFKLRVPNTADPVNLNDLLIAQSGSVDPALVWVGETNNTAFQFWFQPSTANLYLNS